MSLGLYKSNFVKELEEEIALEGLDGITIEALWSRLLDRPQCSIRPNSEAVKCFLWDAVVRLANVKFYLLPSPRPPIFTFHRLENVDSMGNFLETDFPANCYSYPHFLIDTNGEMGSCPLYFQREEITNAVRGSKLKTACESWGESLVIVANQKTRLRVLTEPDSNELLDFNAKQFCFLERVGRSRQHGEVTQGKNGLQAITEDSKTLFYYKKVLSKRKLIKQQLFYLKCGKTSSLTSGLIIHLQKYSKTVKSKFAAASEKLADLISSEPNGIVLYSKAASLFVDRVDLKKLLMRESKKFSTELLPYRRVYPDSSPAEWKTKSSSAEKLVRVIRLLDANDDEDEEDDDEEGEDGDGFLRPQILKLGTSLVRKSYEIIELSGPQGISQSDLRRILGVTNLHARSIVRYLTKKGFLATATVDKGRQRAIHYLSKKFEHSKQSVSNELENQKNKLMKMLARDADQPPGKKSKIETKIQSVPDSKEFLDLAPRNRPSQEEMDAIEVSISMSDYKPPTENFLSLMGNCLDSQNSQITSRLIKRVQMILKAVNTFKVIHDPQKLQRMINEQEEQEGHKYVVDRRSVTRLLDKLVNDGHVRLMKIKLSGHGKEKTMQFIVHPSVTPEHTEILSAIEQAKMKLPIITKDSMRKEARLLRLGNASSAFNLGTYNAKAGRKHGLKPKFVKKQVLHAFLFYLVYGHTGKQATPEEVRDLLISKNVDPSLADEMGPVYSTSGDWKTFLSPVRLHKDYCQGWILVSDALVRLPLSLFLSLVNVPYEIPGLMEYLEHPIRKYYLVKSLPPEITNRLTLHRKYIFVISELITKLAFMGLVQLGPQKLKEKDQYFIYVNRNALLYDTMPSASGYNHISKDINYEITPYEFKSLEDIEQYWYDLWNFAMNTNLGCRNVMSGKPVVIESVCTKNILLEAIVPRTVSEAVEKDIGYLPGDHLGAAGLDSDLFVHLKRNWYYPSEGKIDTQKTIVAPRKAARRVGRKREPPKSDDGPQEFKKIRLVTPSADKGDKNTDDLENVPLSERVNRVEKRAVPPIHELAAKPKAKHKKITRFLQPKQFKTPRRPYYDQVDREALRRMVKLRVDWASNEDNLLLICKVATLYMSADSRRHVAKNYALVREILHSMYPLSQNKTSRACQRRMGYMMKNPSTAHSVYLCLEEIKQDPEITDKFGMAVDKLDHVVKSSGKGPKSCQAEYDKIYKDLVNCLVVKLKTISLPDEATLENVCIPDTVAEFKSKYNIVMPKNLALRYGSFSEVQNIVDIMCSVVYVVIHSSLCCAYDKTSYSYQLFYVYQQYPDKLLRSVITRCRSMQIVSCRKRYKRWKTANSGCLPLGSSPYQLSITYINILQTRYQYSLFVDSRNAIRSIVGQLAFQKEHCISEASSSESYTDPIDVLVSVGGECANIVEMFSAGFLSINVLFPQHLIVLDPRLSEKEESYNFIMKRFEELLKVVNSSNKTGDEGDEEMEDDSDQTPKIKPSIEENSQVNEEFNLNNKSVVANTASRLALYMMRDEPVEHLDEGTQHAHDYFVLKPCKIKVRIDKGKLQNGILSMAEKSSSVVEEVKRLAVLPEECVETCDALDQLKDENVDMEIAKSILDLVDAKKELGAIFSDITSHVSGAIGDIVRHLNLLIDKQFVLRTGQVRLRFVHNKHTKPWVVRSCFISRLQREKLPGATATNASLTLKLPEAEERAKSSSAEGNDESANLQLTSGEEDPAKDQKSPNEDGKSVEEKGTKPHDPVVMVLRNHKKRWTTLKETKFGEVDFSSMKPVVVSMRPWIRIDGTLNRLVLDRLLGSILGHCLSLPGIFVKSLQDRFTPAIQPAHTYELVLILAKIGVVKLEKEAVRKPNLISRRRQHHSEPACGYEDAEVVSVHAQVLAITLFGQFLSDRTAGRDYLDSLTDSRLISFS